MMENDTPINAPNPQTQGDPDVAAWNAVRNPVTGIPQITVNSAPGQQQDTNGSGGKTAGLSPSSSDQFTDEEFQQFQQNIGGTQQQVTPQDTSLAASPPTLQPQGSGNYDIAPRAPHDLPEAPTNPNEMTPEDIEQFDASAKRSQMLKEMPMGPLTDLIAPFNESVLQVLKAAQFPNKIGMYGAEKALESLGVDWLNGQSDKVDPEQFFNMLGIAHNAYPKSYNGEIGRAAWTTALTTLGLWYGAASMAGGQLLNVQAGGKFASIIGTEANSLTLGAQEAVKKYGQWLLQDPIQAFVADQLASAGAVYGAAKSKNYLESEGAGPVSTAAGTTVGGMGGALMGSALGIPAQALTSLIARIPKFTAQRLIQGVDYMLEDTGWYQKLSALSWRQENTSKYAIAKSPKPVDEDLLANARALETQARNANDAVAKAFDVYHSAPEGTTQQSEARAAFDDAKRAEYVANTKAEHAWDELANTKVKVLTRMSNGSYRTLERGALEGVSRQEEALRAPWADVEAPRAYAEDQVRDAQNFIHTEVQNVYDSLKPNPNMGSAEWSRRLSDALSDLNGLAEGVLDKYWARAKLNRRFPNRSILRDMDDFVKSQNDWPEDLLPLKQIDEVRTLFGNIKRPLPTLNQVKLRLTQWRDDRYALQKDGQYQKASRLVAFEGFIRDAVAKSFPDDIPLQQAREASRDYFSLFQNAKSEISQFFRYGDSGGMRVHAEDTLNRILSRNRGMEDYVRALMWTRNQPPIQRGAVKIPVVTKEQRQQIDAMKQDAVEALKSNVQDAIGKVEQDPNKVSKILGDPTFQRRIQSLGNGIVTDVRRASQELSTAAKLSRTITDSAFARYAEMDPEVAITKVWNTGARMARALMDGTVGVGGFHDDPGAMEGFKAGLLDKFASVSQGSPSKMLAMLDGKAGRLLQEVLTKGEYERLNRVINRIRDMQIDETKRQLSQTLWTNFYQMVSLKALHKASEWLPIINVGEGGSLKRASLVSGLTKDIVESTFKHIEPDKLFSEAITNPEFEKVLSTRLSRSDFDYKELVKGLRRMATFANGITGVVKVWLSGATPIPGPKNEPDQESTPLSWLNPISKANAMPMQQLHANGWSNNAEKGILTDPSQLRYAKKWNIGDVVPLQIPSTNDRLSNALSAGAYGYTKNPMAVLEGYKAGKVHPINPTPQGETK